MLIQIYQLKGKKFLFLFIFFRLPKYEIDEHCYSTNRYYRSGMEMVRMANVYQAEGNFENALVLYMKFTTLFIEKIPSHPEYKTFDPVSKRLNKEKLKEIFPIAERLKAKLLEKFQHDYKEYLEVEKHKRIEREREAAAAQRQKEKVFFF